MKVAAQDLWDERVKRYGAAIVPGPLDFEYFWIRRGLRAAQRKVLNVYAVRPRRERISGPSRVHLTNDLDGVWRGRIGAHGGSAALPKRVDHLLEAAAYHNDPNPNYRELVALMNILRSAEVLT